MKSSLPWAEKEGQWARQDLFSASVSCLTMSSCLLKHTFAQADTKVDGVLGIIGTLGVSTLGKVGLQVLGLAEAEVHVGLFARQRRMLGHDGLEAVDLCEGVRSVLLWSLCFSTRTYSAERLCRSNSQKGSRGNKGSLHGELIQKLYLRRGQARYVVQTRGTVSRLRLSYTAKRTSVTEIKDADAAAAGVSTRSARLIY